MYPTNRSVIAIKSFFEFSIKVFFAVLLLFSIFLSCFLRGFQFEAFKCVVFIKKVRAILLSFFLLIMNKFIPKKLKSLTFYKYILFSLQLRFERKKNILVKSNCAAFFYCRTNIIDKIHYQTFNGNHVSTMYI